MITISIEDKKRMLHYDYEDFVAGLAKRIKELRKDRHLTQMQIMTQYGYHKSHWQNAESGRKMSLETLLRVANTFDVSVEELVGGIERQPGLGMGSKGFEGSAMSDDE